jgi:hypothetical protein
MFRMMQAMVTCSEQQMSELKDDQIDFDRVVTDPEYRRHVIVYLNSQARTRDPQRAGGRTPVYGKILRAELLRRLG